MAKILIKRGQSANLKDLTLAPGELAVTLDTGKLYVGTGTTDTPSKTLVNPDVTSVANAGKAAKADKLTTARTISLSGDATGSTTFDGSSNKEIAVTLANSGVTAGTYPKVTVDAKGRVTAGAALAATDIPNLTSAKITDFSTKVGTIIDGKGYQTASQVSSAVNSAVSGLVNSAPETLDTLKELADALGNDANFAATVSTNIGKKEDKLSGATAKTAPVDADNMIILDSAASSATKKLTFSALKAFLKTYFDTLYNKYTLPTASDSVKGGVKVGTGLAITNEVLGVKAATTSTRGAVVVGTGLNVDSNGTLSLGDVDGGTF